MVTAQPGGQITTAVAECADDELATGGGILSTSTDNNIVNPAWQHRGIPLSDPTTWELNYANPAQDPVQIQAYAECAKLVDVP
jgi:hypothetical protein